MPFIGSEFQEVPHFGSGVTPLFPVTHTNPAANPLINPRDRTIVLCNSKVIYPPSSDPPGIKKAKKKAKSNRNQGGQPGHKGRNRKLLPIEEMDKIHDIYPERCEHCRNPL
jgi:hypothetical protein